MAGTSPLNQWFMIAVREIEQDLRRRWSRPGQSSFNSRRLSPRFGASRGVPPSRCTAT
jgi:hypothetical protein